MKKVWVKSVISTGLLASLAAFSGGPQLHPSATRPLNRETAKSVDPFAAAMDASRAAVKDMMERSGVPGVSVAVVVDGEIVWSEGFGFADLEHRVPVTPQAKFGIGSISKSFTTAVFARLVQRGLLNWDSSVQGYLPDFPHPAITPRMIAGHVSGLDDTFSSSHRMTSERFTTQEALRSIIKEPLRQSPGTKFFYATGPYTILAGILEQKLGKDFRGIVDQELLHPLGLDDTVPNDRWAIVPNRTAFYEAEEAGKKRNVYSDPSFKWAGAGYLSTPSDLARFGNALLRGDIVRGTALDELFQPIQTTSVERPVTGTGAMLRMKDTGVGLGWTLAVDNDGRRVMHQPGGGPGISAWLILYPDQRLVIAILSNETGAPVGGKAFRVIAESFLGGLGPTSSDEQEAGTRDLRGAFVLRGLRKQRELGIRISPALRVPSRHRR